MCTQQVDMIAQWQVVLWFCGNQAPNANEDWLLANCSSYLNLRTIQPLSANTTVTSRAPTNSQAPVTATGWYIGDMFFNAYDTHNGQTEIKGYGWYWSPGVYCSSSTHTCT